MGFIWLIPRSDTGNQEGIPRPAGRGSGLCPENPQPFEKGWRKLQQGCGDLMKRNRCAGQRRDLRQRGGRGLREFPLPSVRVRG